MVKSLKRYRRWLMYSVCSLVWLCLISSSLCAQSKPQEEERPLIVVNVVDAESRPIPTARVSAYWSLENVVEPLTNEFEFYGYHPVNARGRLVIDDYFNTQRLVRALQQKAPVRLSLRVVAPGYVPLLKELENEIPSEITVTLQKGRVVELFLYDWNGKPFSLNVTSDYFERGSGIGSADPARSPFSIEIQGEPSWDTPRELTLNFGLEQVADGHYRFCVPEALDTTLVLSVMEPKIRGYSYEMSPEMLRSGKVEVRLPQPSRVMVEIDFSALLKAQVSDQEAYVLLSPAGRGDNFVFSQYLQQTVPVREKVTLSFAGVAPGEWELRCFLMGGASERTKFTIDSNETKQVRLAMELEDPSKYRGNRTVTLEVVRSGGTPASNQPFRIELLTPKGFQRIPLASGTLDEQGKATLKELYENEEDTEEQVSYTVYVGEQRVGDFRLLKGDEEDTVRFVMPPTRGEPAPDLSLVDLATGETVKLSELRGNKWVYLEFWATWCGPCQEALKELKQVLERYHEQWKDRLVVVTVSVDDEREIVRPHLERRGWWEMARHTWSSPTDENYAGTLYGVQYIPVAFLINPEGKVVWSGVPFQQAEQILKQYLTQAQ